MRVEPLHDRGEPVTKFRVVWQKQNGEVHEDEVIAFDAADAAFRVADATFDTFHPSGRQLLGVMRLT